MRLPADLPGSLPTPLALASSRLAEAERRGNALAVLFFLRDAVECHLRLLAAAGLAERLAAAGRDEGALRELAADHLSTLLGKQPGLGDWVGRVRALAASGATEGEVVRPALRRIVDAPGWRRLFDGTSDFVAFRNRTLGHGAYRADADVLAEAGEFLGPLTGLAEVAGVALWTGAAIEAAGLLWRGPEPETLAPSASGGWTSAVLRFDGPAAGRPPLALDPLVRAHWDAAAGEWDLLLFSELRWNGRTPESARAHFLDYLRGSHRTERPFLPVVERYFHFLSFRHGRREVGSGEAKPEPLALAAPLPVEHLERPLVAWAAKTLRRPERGGYLRLVGPAGSGKSWFLLDAMRWAASPRDPSEIQESPLHLPPPRLCRFLYSPARDGVSPEAFWGALARQARELRLHTADLSRLTGCRDLGQWARELFELNRELLGESFLFVVLDGLDELPERSSRDERPTAWLTPLPARCGVLLASRPEVTRGVEEDLLALERRERGELPVLHLDPASEENLRLQRYYVGRQLPGLGVERTEALLAASAGVFHYTHQFAHALRLGVLRAEDPLPAKEALARRLLGDLRRRAGEEIFRRVHLRLLAALAAAREPLTAAALAEHWGLHEGGLAPALQDLDFLLASVRGEGSEERYAFGHALVGEQLAREGEVAAEVAAAHAQYAARVGQELRVLSAKGGLWAEIDPLEDASFAYALLHLPWHLRQAGESERAETVARDPGYRRALREAALAFRRRGEFARAESFWQALLSVQEELAHRDPALRRERVEGLVEYAEHLNATSQVTRVLEIAARAEQLGREAGDSRLAGLAAMRAGYAAYLGSRPELARDLLARALAALEAGAATGLEIAECRLYQAEVDFFYREDAARAEAACRELAVLAERLGDRVLRAKVGHLFGRVLYSDGRTEESLPELEPALACFAEAGLADWETDVLGFLSGPYLDLGRAEEALEVARRAWAGYRRYGDLLGAMETAWAQGDVHLASGRLAEAERWYREARSLAALCDPGRPAPVLGLAASLLRQGRLDEARATMAEASALVAAPEYVVEREELAELEAELRRAQESPLG